MGAQTEHVYEEVEDLDVPPRSWLPGAGDPPLLVIRNDAGETERALEPMRIHAPTGAQPARGDRWLDVGAGYGLWSILAARRGGIAYPVEPDDELRPLIRRNAFLADVDEAPGRTGVVYRPFPGDQPIVELIEREQLTALRFGLGRPWLRELPPAIDKVVAIVPARDRSSTCDALAAQFGNVTAVPFARAFPPRVQVAAWRRR